jgi:hypothetical protein
MLCVYLGRLEGTSTDMLVPEQRWRRETLLQRAHEMAFLGCPTILPAMPTSRTAMPLPKCRHQSSLLDEWRDREACLQLLPHKDGLQCLLFAVWPGVLVPCFPLVSCKQCVRTARAQWRPRTLVAHSRIPRLESVHISGRPVALRDVSRTGRFDAVSRPCW